MSLVSGSGMGGFVRAKQGCMGSFVAAPDRLMSKCVYNGRIQALRVGDVCQCLGASYYGSVRLFSIFFF